MPHIFERFYQCEESHQATGNGLGLAIVQRIIDLLHGRIEIVSKVNHGTKIVVILPKNL